MVREQSYNTTGAAIGQTLNGANTDRSQAKTGTNYQAAGDTIIAPRSNYVKKNSPDAGDKLVVDTVTAKAVENRDPKMLDILKRNVPGTNYTFADTPYGRAKYDQTTEDLVRLRDAAYKKQMATISAYQKGGKPELDAGQRH